MTTEHQTKETSDIRNPRGERSCVNGVDHNGEPTKEQYVRAQWADSRIAAIERENAVLEENAIRFREERDRLRQSQSHEPEGVHTVATLMDRLDRINAICHEARSHGEKVELIKDASSGFARGPHETKDQHEPLETFYRFMLDTVLTELDEKCEHYVTATWLRGELKRLDERKRAATNTKGGA